MNAEKRLKTVTVVDTQEDEADFPPTSLQGCISWFADKLDEVPVEHCSTAMVEFGVVDGYESSRDVTITVTYRRPETDEDEADRLRKEQKLSRYQEDRERETLAKLKAKYEGK